jgi:Xaa-Pro dipeptidase
MSFSRRHFLKAGGLSILSTGTVGKLFANNTISFKTQLDNLTKDVKPLTPSDYEERIEKARKLMRMNEIDALFLTGGVDLNYFTKVSWGESERPFGAVINQKTSPIWICPAFELDRAKQRIPKEHDVRTWQEDESPYKLINGIMKDIEAKNKKLALGPSVRSFISYGLRKNASEIELVNGAIITEGCRGVKTQKEIEFMELANKITKLAFKETFKQLKEGMTPQDIGKIFSSNQKDLGANGGTMVLLGPISAFPHGSLNIHNLENGDPILVDGGCSIEGYSSDVSRTIIFGKPTDKHLKVWDIVKKAQSEALKAVRPGVSCGDIDFVARKVIEDAGYGPGYKYFTHRLGHGIGMDGHEYPYLLKGNKLKLEPGMTFSNEPGIYIPGEFGIRIEDCFVVTSDGGHHLGGMETTALDRPFGE